MMLQTSHKPRLEEFKKKYIAKYEDEAVPIMQAIDTDSGISFGDFEFQSDNVFLKDTYFPKNSKNIKSGNYHDFKKFIYKKYIESYIEKSYQITLTDKDVSEFQHKVSSLPSTFQIIFSVAATSPPVLNIVTAGNASAANLIARFANWSNDIKSLLNEISDHEKDFYNDCIVAEIVHIPERRIGNVSFRPFVREYEIPVMTQSELTEEFQIPLHDLHVMVRSGRIILFSKERKIKIVPTLTNAHNYNKKTSPIYQFLSELQYQDITPSLSFDMADLDFLTPFVPRIKYKNIIISAAYWTFKRDNLKNLYSTINELSIHDISLFRKEWRLPVLTDYYLKGVISIVDWSSVRSVKHFLNIFKSDNVLTVTLREFLYDPKDSFVTDSENNGYVSQCIALVKNNFAVRPPFNLRLERSNPIQIKRHFAPGEEWVYFKLYGGRSKCDKFLRNELLAILAPIIENKHVKKFFYIRYEDTAYHLRLRVCCEHDKVGEIISYLSQKLNIFFSNQTFWKIQIDTYDREIERYGVDTMELAESLFEADSLYWISFMNIVNQDVDYLLPLFFIRSTLAILDGLDLELQERFQLFDRMRYSYELEFGVSQQKHLQKIINQKEKELRLAVEMMSRDDFSPVGHLVDSSEIQKLLIHFSKSIYTINEEYLPKVPRNEILNIVPSIIHMHAIRCFAIKPRENELFAYNILWSLHKKLINTVEKVDYERIKT